MEIREIINNKDIEYTNNRIGSEEVTKYERELGVEFGNELTQYILQYGYLAYKHIELYGINSNQMEESDMIKQTQYLHKYFIKTMDYIAIENTGDGNYIIVDSNDYVYMYSSEEDNIRAMGKRLFDYIIKRFSTGIE